MKDALTRLAMAAVTIWLFPVALLVNDALFPWLEWAPGIHFVYSSAGVRMLCTLLFAEAGAVDLLAVSWLACFLWLSPDDPLRSFMGGVMGAMAPYAAYRFAKRWYGIGASLQQLSLQRLLALSVLYALANSLLHHIGFAIRADAGVVPGFAAMFVGDGCGALIVLYAVKWVLSRAWPAHRLRV